MDIWVVSSLGSVIFIAFSQIMHLMVDILSQVQPADGLSWALNLGCDVSTLPFNTSA